MLNYARTGRGKPLLLLRGIGSRWRIALASAPGVDATLPHVAGWERRHGDLGAPLTIGWGTRDAVLIPRRGGRARRRMPGARHVWLRGCGHAPTWDEPAAVAAVLPAGPGSV